MHSQELKALGYFPDTDPDNHWWVPAGRIFYTQDSNDTPTQELVYAGHHFFMPQRYRDPFGQVSFASFDKYDLLIAETRDPLGNCITVGERDSVNNLTAQGNDYRVLQPHMVMDSNFNRTAVVFDALGIAVGTAVMGKPPPSPAEGDSFVNFETNLTENVIRSHLENPLSYPSALQHASTRIIYDMSAFYLTRGQSNPQPTVIYTISREIHDSNLEWGMGTPV